MSNIEQNLQKILTSRYGKDVRQFIHDSIHDCYEDGKAGSIDLVAREQIANLVSINNPTEGNSELQDIRVGFDGTTYESAGEAVRQQVIGIHDALDVSNNIALEQVTKSVTMVEFPKGGAIAVTSYGDVFYYGGKNLIHAEETTVSSNGIKAIFKNGVVSVKGTASGNTNIFIPINNFNIISNKKYTFDWYLISGGNKSIGVSIDANKYGSVLLSGLNVINGEYAVNHLTVSAAVSNDAKYLRLYIQNGFEVDTEFKIMLTVGSQERTEFEYSSFPSVGSSKKTFYTTEYLCIQSFDSVSVEYYVKKSTNYNNLTNIPVLNGVKIEGDKKLSDYGIEEEYSPIKRKYPIYGVKTDTLIVNSTTSGYTEEDPGNMYNAVSDGYINDLFRYSEPVKINSDSGVSFVEPTSQNGYTIEFYFTGNKMSISGYSGNFRFLVADDKNILMDQVYQNPSPVIDGRAYTRVEFPDSKRRKICISCSGKFWGIKTEGTIEKFIHDRLRLVADGDSIVYGVNDNAGFTNTLNIFGHIAKAFDMDLINTGIGSTGYVATGTVGKTFADRILNNVYYNPDIFIIMGGLNDRNAELNDIKNHTTTVRDAIYNYFEKAKSQIGAKYFIGISPFCPNASLESLSPLEQIGEYCRFACVKNKIPYIDTLHGITYDAFGSVISDNSKGYNPSLISNENRNKYISEDNVHPTREGDRYIGLRLIQEIWKVLYKEYGFIIE